MLADPERIVVTTGYVQALVLLTTVLRDAGRPVLAMEDPGLPFHREVVRRQGGRVVPLPVDDRGVRTELLGAGGPSFAYPAALAALAAVLGAARAPA
ncbi:hypothetical protein [Micromonospora sp. RTP1Z1]|uniref:hypothetical protein n=1 Tax=Micromonospora sp. RTP1Z1 TaxID=2994043 RepID=UPI0029C883FA|nr:hypothetical protein [Micromonospora sp. RTP1Z1]